MNGNIRKFLFVTLFSYFGDVLAVMCLPLILLRKTGDLVSASQFTVLAIAAALIGARPAALLLKKIHPLKLIFFSDLIGCLFLLLLANQADSATATPAYFLGLCFITCLVLNFPMFAKSQLLYQYFISKEEMVSASALQGKLIGIVFVLSLLSIGILFDTVGFRWVIILDVLTYVPLLIMCWNNRDSRPLGYETQAASPASSMPGSFSGRARSIAAYYLFNASTYFFSTLRSHLLITILTAFYPGLGLAGLCLAVATGALGSLALHKLTHGGLAQSPLISALAMASGTLLLGVLIAYSRSGLALVAVGFLLSEIGAISLQMQRQFQVEIAPYYPATKLATYAIVSGSVISALLIPMTMKSLVLVGALATFGSLALFLAAASFVTVRASAAAAAALALGLFMTATNLRAEKPAFEYRTVMSDKPRLLPRLGANTMSEDERFVLNNIHCGLFQTDVTGGIRPELAASWSVEDDGTVYRFKVKDGFKDSGGNRIDAEYVYRSIQKSLELSIVKKVWENPNSAIRGYKEIVGFEKCVPGSCNLPGLRLTGNEIVIRLKRKWPAFLELLVRHMLPIYRSEKSPIGEDIPIGCGAYQVSDYSASSMTLVKNPNSPQLEPRAPDVFTIDFTDPRTAVRGFCANKYYDLIFFAPTRKELSAAGCVDDRIVWREADTAGYWAINMGSQSIFKNPALFSRLSDTLDPAEFRAVWNIDSAPQISTIPKIFGGPRSAGQVPSPRKKSAPNSPAITQKVTVRYIDGTPEHERLALAVGKWMKRAKIDYALIPTPFTEFCEDLSKGSSAVYIYGESPLSKLVNFLAPIFEMSSRHYKGAELSRLKRAWSDFLRDDTSPALAELDQMFLSSNRFVPLFVARRPLVFIRGYYIRRHNERGLATLSIHEFRSGKP